MGGFNPLCNSKVNKLKKTGGVGYSEKQYEAVLDVTHAFTAQLVTSTAYPETKFTGNEKLYELGHTSYVYWDGNLYTCQSVNDTDGGYSHIYIGNFAKFSNAGDTGEPFCLIAMATGMWMLNCFDELNATHTFKLCDKVETIHPIDPKFIPGAVLPVVELETIFVVTESGTGMYDLTEHDNEEFEKANETILPIVLRVHIADIEGNESICVGITQAVDGDAHMFRYILPSMSTGFILFFYDSGWKAICSEATEGI